MTEQLPLGFDAPAKRKRTARLEHFHARHESPAEALAGEQRAARQETQVLMMFADDFPHDYRLTPSDIAERQFARGWPLTSIRRALTNLTKRGLLTKHPEDRRPTPRGGKECTWSIRVTDR